MFWEIFQTYVQITRIMHLRVIKLNLDIFTLSPCPCKNLLQALTITPQAERNYSFLPGRNFENLFPPVEKREDYVLSFV